MRLSVRRPGGPLAVAALAAAITFLGCNLGGPPAADAANTASRVNIADPATPGNLARVSSGGALSTSVSGLVSNLPGTPATPLNLDASGVVDSGLTELVVPTTAHIDLTSLTVAAAEAENQGGNVRVFVDITEAPAGTPPGDCATDSTSFSEIQQFDLQSGTTVTLSPSSPIVMAPPAGKDECIEFGATPDTGTDSGQIHVSATGFVTSGTYTGPHGTG